MPRRTRRTFTPEFKARVALEALTGAASQAELCRRHQLNPTLLALWKATLLERLPAARAALRRGRPHRRAGAPGRPAGPGAGRPKKSLDAAGLDHQRRREVVMRLAGEYPVRLLCRLLGCPRAGVYRAAAIPADEA